MDMPADQHAATVTQSARDTNEIRRILFEQLQRGCITPMDREDVVALSRAIGDVMELPIPLLKRCRS